MSDLTAAVEAVLSHQWGALAWSAHNRHKLDSECAVCREDVPAMLAVAAPVLLAERDAELATLRAELEQARAAYALKLADFAAETQAVEILAARLKARGCGPDGWFAEEGHGRTCQDCVALRKALVRVPASPTENGDL